MCDINRGAVTRTLHLDVRELDSLAGLVTGAAAVIAHVMSLQTGEPQDRIVLYPADTQAVGLGFYQRLAVFVPSQGNRLITINNGTEQRKSLIYSQSLMGITWILNLGRN